MIRIIHKDGNVKLPKYNLDFLPGVPVEVYDEALAAKILRNPDFVVFQGKVETKKKKGEF